MNKVTVSNIVEIEVEQITAPSQDYAIHYAKVVAHERYMKMLAGVGITMDTLEALGTHILVVMGDSVCVRPPDGKFWGEYNVIVYCWMVIYARDE